MPCVHCTRSVILTVLLLVKYTVGQLGNAAHMLRYIHTVVATLAVRLYSTHTGRGLVEQSLKTDSITPRQYFSRKFLLFFMKKSLI